MTDIKIITTGGTIDKIYFDAKSEFQVGAPQIGEVLKEANVAPCFEITSLLRKDSLDLTDADRNRIYKAVKSCPQNRVIVTHGTDTMITTALVLKKIAQKTIVLTGHAAGQIPFYGCSFQHRQRLCGRSAFTGRSLHSDERQNIRSGDIQEKPRTEPI
jgi:hypothetical protein